MLRLLRKLFGQSKTKAAAHAKPKTTAPRLGESAFHLEDRIALSRAIQSVVAIRDATPNPMTYQIRFGTVSETFTLQPGATRLYATAGANQRAVVTYDGSAAPGFQGVQLKLPSKNFVAGGPEGGAVRSASDGMVHAFRVNANSTGWTMTSPASLDTTRNPTGRAQVFQMGFPNLGSNFEVIGARTGTSPQQPGQYNCISWSLGEVNRWINPVQSVAAWDAVYGQKGYQRMASLDFTLRAGYEKVVVYAKRGATGGVEFTHAARQETDGTWSSKLGSGALIKHVSPHQLNGTTYGQPVLVYVRRVA